MIVAVIGGAGAGKSTFARALSGLLEVPWLGPDRYRRGEGSWRTVWARLLADVRATDGVCIVESCIAPDEYRALLADCGMFVVLVETDMKTRARRMHRRSWEQSHLRGALHYRPPLRADVRVNGTAPVEPQAAWVARIIEGVRDGDSH